MSPERAPLPASRALAWLRRRTAAAVVVSLLLHGGMALAFMQGWGAARPIAAGGTAMQVTLVTGPLQGGGAPDAKAKAPDAAAGATGDEAPAPDSGAPASEDPANDPEPAGSPEPETARPAERAERKEPAVSPHPPLPSTPQRRADAAASSEAPETLPVADLTDTSRPETAAAPSHAEAALDSTTPRHEAPPPPSAKPSLPQRPTVHASAAVPPPPAKPDSSAAATSSAAGATAQSAPKAPAESPPRAAAERRPQFASLGPAADGGAGNTSGSAPAGSPAAGDSAGQGARGAAPMAGNPAPRYPARARRRGWEGRVVLEVTVRPDGGVGRIGVLVSSGFADLDDAARKAVGKWRFEPATHAGRPVGDTIRVPVRFTLEEG